jgi:hypothetical protein
VRQEGAVSASGVVFGSRKERLLWRCSPVYPTAHGSPLVATPIPTRCGAKRAWRRPSLFTSQEAPLALQYGHRQRLDDDALAQVWPRTIAWFVLTELEVSRRVVEAPLASISRVTRDALLSAQGAYLLRLYAALAAQIGEAAALAEFERLLLSAG